MRSTFCKKMTLSTYNFCKMLMLLCFTLTTSIRAELQVTDDPKNILSKRIAGKWIQNEPLSRELWGKEELEEKEMRFIEVTSDASVLEKIPAEIGEVWGKDGSKIYFSGWLTVGGKRYPCFLRQFHGNTCLTFYDHENKGFDSINIMMAVGASPKVDQLFVGGRYTSEGTLPFYAYRRVTEHAEDGTGQPATVLQSKSPDNSNPNLESKPRPR